MDPNNDTKAASLTEDQLASKISEAVFSGDSDALDALMTAEVEPAVDTASEPVVSEEAKEANPEDTNPPAAEAVKAGAQDVAGTVAAQPEVPKELKEELDRLRRIEHAYKSEAGRTPTLQRKLAEVEKELEKLRSPQPSETGTKTTSKGKASDRIEQLKETDPFLAELVEDMYSELKGEVTSAKTEAQQQQEQREMDSLLRTEADKLTAYHQNAFDVFDLPEWSRWKESQTPGVKALADSMYADDVIKAFQYFYHDMLPKYNEAASTPAVANPTPVQAAPVVDARASKVEEERKRKLEANNLGSKPVSIEGDGIPTDPDKLHDYFYKQALKEMGLLKTK